ncbi:SMAD/FHA domain-containing protein, partial [Metschnikowia bicuspidata var. bicuspidata NRRL YB-4993]
DKDGMFSVRLTPIIDHSAPNTGLYFSPIIRRIEPKQDISIGRYTEKHKSAAHAPQGSSSRIVFKSKVVSRTHALFQCNEEGLWFLKDCKSSSGTFLNNIRLSLASQELTLWPLMDGDVVQLGLDYRGGTEEVYRSVRMRCEFNRSWQRKVNRFNLDIHKKMKNLGIDATNENGEVFSECAICLLKLEPCQAVFISPCSHSWHYKCIRPIIIKRYPQFYCPNCRSICDLETDIEDE